LSSSSSRRQAGDLAAALWDGCDAAVASRLAYPEVRAALAAFAAWDRRLRSGVELAGIELAPPMEPVAEQPPPDHP
jgi:hypothetical protein